MKIKLNIRNFFLISLVIFVISTSIIIVYLYFNTKNMILIYILLALLFLILLWSYFFEKRLQKSFETFTFEICDMIDNMLNNSLNTESISYSEDLYDKVRFKILRIDEILKEDKKLLSKEKKLLQSFISDTAHQIKTPMANLKIISDTLLINNITEEERLSFLQNSSTQLLRLEFILDALIKCSRLETGLVLLTKKNYLIQEIISDAITHILPLLTEKQQEITLDCTENLSVYADKKWLTESIFNILENAVKYTNKKGNISIYIVKNEMYTVISIKDNGCGIKETEIGNIFNRFYRGENTLDTEGAGIGLYLAREIITLHSGYISIKSKINEGSTFKIHLL